MAAKASNGGRTALGRSTSEGSSDLHGWPRIFALATGGLIDTAAKLGPRKAGSLAAGLSGVFGKPNIRPARPEGRYLPAGPTSEGTRWSHYISLALSRTPLGSMLRRVPFVEATYNHSALICHDQSHLLSGTYSTYAQARAAIPRGRAAGWDNEAAATIWSDCVDPVRPGIYPLFFWLLRLLRPGASLIDYGGSVGLTYYGYHRYASLPERARSIVVELPQTAVQCRRIAERKDARNLFFTSDITTPSACDILLAAGSLQYVEHSVPGLLELRSARPRWPLLNKLPLTKGAEFWALDNFGPAVAPYRVFNEQAFVSYFERRGYVVRDRWQVAELKCDIAFHPANHLTQHTGLCLERRG